MELSERIRKWLESDKSIAYVRKRAELLVIADDVAQFEEENERLEETNKGLFGIVKAYHPEYIGGCPCPQCSDMPIYVTDDQGVNDEN